MGELEEVPQYEEIQKMTDFGVNAQDVKRLQEAGQPSTRRTHSLHRSESQSTTADGLVPALPLSLPSVPRVLPR